MADGVPLRVGLTHAASGVVAPPEGMVCVDSGWLGGGLRLLDPAALQDAVDGAMVAKIGRGGAGGHRRQA